MKRAKLIDTLENLLNLEEGYDARELMSCSKKELMMRIIDVAEFYKNEYNN